MKTIMCLALTQHSRKTIIFRVEFIFDKTTWMIKTKINETGLCKVSWLQVLNRTVDS